MAFRSSFRCRTTLKCRTCIFYRPAQAFPPLGEGGPQGRMRDHTPFRAMPSPHKQSFPAHSHGFT